MATVETRGVKKYYGDVVAVDGVDLVTKDGEFLVLLGPSGCGKTTLLRMIAGFETPSAGELVIAGEVVNDLPPRARKIAMVFQSYALYPHMTVFKNIAFPLKAQRVAKAAIPQRWSGPLRFSALATCFTASHASFPAASASEWPWPVPWCVSRQFSCWMSRSRI
mgnify:CR=1 FL=1